MSLISLPLEVWYDLSNYIETPSLIKLMMSGSKALRHRLTRGVTNLHFSCSDPPQGIIDLDVSDFVALQRYIMDFRTHKKPHNAFFERLPPSLLHLHIPSSTCLVPSLKLPQCLTSLSINGCDDISPIIPLLPNSLQRLLCPTASFSPFHVSSLPSGLHTLKCCFDVGGVDFNQFPRGLTSLELRFDYQPSLASISGLPPHLNHLSLECSLTDENFFVLPQGLTSLSLTYYKTLLSLEIFKHLPPRLTHLALPTKLLNTIQDEQFLKIIGLLKPHDFSSNNNLTPAIIDSLPHAYITHPTKLPYHLRKGVLPKYLASIRSVMVEEWMVPHFAHVETWRLLAPNTTALNLGKLTHTSPEVFNHFPTDLQSLTCPALNNSSFIAQLPLSLTQLRALRVMVDDTHIRQFPRSLLILDLAKADLLTDACIPHLPPQLEVLIIPKASQLTNASISLLPRSLKVLDISWASSIDDSAIPHLPPLLTSLCLSSTRNLTDASLPHFPKSISVLNLTHSHNLSHAALVSNFPPNIQIILPYGRKISQPW